MNQLRSPALLTCFYTRPNLSIDLQNKATNTSLLWLPIYCNKRFSNHLRLPGEHEIKDITDTPTSAAYLDMKAPVNLPNYATNVRVWLALVNYPFLDSNVPASPAHGVYMSTVTALFHLACSCFQDFTPRSRILTRKLLRQGCEKFRLIETSRKVHGRHSDLVWKNI